MNCIPVFIAREDYWDKRFKKAGLPIVGDDIKSQVGATIVHRTLARLFHERGVKMLRTSQLNVGGNMDFYNMLERERLESKKISKTNAVTSIMGHELPADDVYIGPSDYVPWLTDRKWAHIRLEGQAFGDVPLNVELKLEVWDSPNSAGIVIDAVRCCKLGAQPRRRRPARRPELVPHEVAAEPAPRRRGARGDREVHREVRRQRAGAQRRQAQAAAAKAAPAKPAACHRSADRAAGRADRRARATADSVPGVPEHAAALRQLAISSGSSSFCTRAHRRLARRREPARPRPLDARRPTCAPTRPRTRRSARRLCAPREAPRAPARDERDDRRAASRSASPRADHAANSAIGGAAFRIAGAPRGRHDRPLPELRALRRRHRRPHGARGVGRDGRARRRRPVAAAARADPGARDHRDLRDAELPRAPRRARAARSASRRATSACATSSPRASRARASARSAARSRPPGARPSPTASA